MHHGLTFHWQILRKLFSLSLTQQSLNVVQLERYSLSKYCKCIGDCVLVGAAKGTIFGILLQSPPLLTRKYFNLMQYFEFNVDCKYKIIIRKKSARNSEVLRKKSHKNTSNH